MKALLQANPIRVMTSLLVVLQAGFALGAAFGHALTATQQAAITGFLTVIANEVGRGQVTPNVNVPQPLPSSLKG